MSIMKIILKSEVWCCVIPGDWVAAPTMQSSAFQQHWKTQHSSNILLSHRDGKQRDPGKRIAASGRHRSTVHLDWALACRMHWIFDSVGSCMGWDVKGLLLFLLIFILTADYLKNRRSGSFPPGPRAIPIVGNLFTLDHSRAHESMTQVDLNQS